jgi:hypothetical protein
VLALMVASLVISCVLFAAALGKLLTFAPFIRSIESRLGSRSRALMLGAIVLILELSISLSMWTPARAPGALALTVFLFGANVWLLTGDAVHRDVVLSDCQCFGSRSTQGNVTWIASSALKPAWWALRNGALAGVSIFVLSPGIGIERALSIGLATSACIALSVVALAVQSLRRLLPGTAS